MLRWHLNEKVVMSDGIRRKTLRLFACCLYKHQFMLTKIQNLPDYVLGVRAAGEVDKNDLDTVLLPGLQALTDQFGEIYYLLVLETPVQNFTAGAWWSDLVAGIKHLTHWKKMAIVTDQKAVENFTDMFSYVSPGEAKGFQLSELDEAISWVSTKAD
ncbi:STAS/SEC14 domain-containing protein [Pedobacter sp. MC2016-14]|uniref:STAS/SEC14 domain-containing protein n=1 Tax=Pedobacter sp. MC2016-14 TaxID=2897327 RepID=UPI001E5E217E|nr:STAS/SEC14 domain-containing protein [Pedobacter sp. MC2016-14]MCD0489949.1 STAS/SEC14 domain-containing protein [Pedobacter sp. MC2016-14]